MLTLHRHRPYSTSVTKNQYTDMTPSPLFPIGTRSYQATVSMFERQPKIHIRKYIENQEQEKCPTRYGIALNVDEWSELTDIIAELDEMVQALTNENNEQEQASKEPKTELIKKHYSKKNKKNYKKKETPLNY